MDNATLIAVWMVAITGPCVLCWLAGDIFGAARIRDLYAGDAVSPGWEAAWDGRAAQTSAEVRADAPQRACYPLDGTSGRKPISFEEQAALAEWRRKLRGVLSQSHKSVRARMSDDGHPHSGLTVRRFDPRLRPDPFKAISEYQDAVASLEGINRAMASQPPLKSGTYASRVELAERREWANL